MAMPGMKLSEKVGATPFALESPRRVLPIPSDALPARKVRARCRNVGWTALQRPNRLTRRRCNNWMARTFIGPAAELPLLQPSHHR